MPTSFTFVAFTMGGGDGLIDFLVKSSRTKTGVPFEEEEDEDQEKTQE